MSRKRTSIALPTQRRGIVALCFLLLLPGCAIAQESASSQNPSGPNLAVPNMVKFSGTIPGMPAGTAGLIFALYQDQSGGAPLWQEVQNVTVDSNGHYTALLGSGSAAGIPLEVFSSNEARWLGVEVQGQAEQARVLLVSVPYALKAADAQTLGGLPASAFLRADAVPAPATTAYVNSAAVTSAARQAVAAAIPITATAGTLPVFTDASGDLGNSLVSQVSTATGGAGNFVGINTTKPVADFHILGVDPTLRIEQYGPVGSGDSPNFNFYSGNGTAGSPTATQKGDNLGQFAATGFNGAALGGSKVKVSFVATDIWTAIDNGTAMSFQTTANTDTTTKRTERMRIDNTGYVGIGDFSATPPAYTLTVNGVIDSTSGGFRFPDGSTLATAAFVPSTAVSNTFTGNQTISNGYEAIDGSVYVDANHLNNGTALAPGLSFGGVGTGEGIASNRNSGVNQYGLDFYTNRLAGMSITNGGLVGIGTKTPAAQLEVNNSSQQVGVFGVTGGESTPAPLVFEFGYDVGVWGDTGASSIAFGVLGTANNNYAGGFINVGPSAPTLYAENDETTSTTSPVFETYSSTGGCTIDVGGNLTCGGAVKGVATVAAGARKVAVYAVQSAENWFEDAGSGRLSNGSAQVALDSTFAQTVNGGVEYHVFLTPEGDCKGLYVSAKTASGFEVHELGGGQSSIAFDYRIMAKRAGYEDVRFEDLTEQMKRQAEEHKKLHPAARSVAAPRVSTADQAR